MYIRILVGWYTSVFEGSVCLLYVSVYQVRVGMVLDGIIVISLIRTYLCTYITCF